MTLAEVLAEHRVVVCLGSGGVGKTTTSAALSLWAALHGQHALCLTIDPARRLANSLGLDQLSRQEQVIEPRLFEQHGLECTGQLSAMMLDMKHTFDELVERHASSQDKRERILSNRLYQYVSTSLAGTQEYMAMEKLHAVRGDGRFDLIVLDTPPTANALDFLDAPQKLVGAIDSPVMRWFVEQLDEGAGLSLVGKSAAFVLRGLSRFTGAAFLEQIGEFVTGINELFGGFRDRAQAVYDDLRGDDVAFLIVTSPSPLAVAEASFFSKKLDAYGIKPVGVVVNRVNADVEPTDGLDSERLTRHLPSSVDSDDLLSRMQLAAADARAIAERDREGVHRLRRHVGSDLSYVEVPAFERDVNDLGALSAVAQVLLGTGEASDGR